MLKECTNSAYIKRATSYLSSERVRSSAVPNLEGPGELLVLSQYRKTGNSGPGISEDHLLRHFDLAYMRGHVHIWE